MKEVLNGAIYLKQGLQLATNPGLRRYAVVPLIVNILFFCAMAYFFFSGVGELLASVAIEATLPNWLSWFQVVVDFFVDIIAGLLWLVVGAAFLFLMAYTFTSVTHLIASPFNGILAERVEERLRDIDYPEHKMSQIVLRSVAREIRKLAYWGLRAIGLLVVTSILSFIPVLNLLGPVLWFVFGAWFMAIQYIDIAADNNGHSFQETLSKMRNQRYLVMGFGGITALLTITPIVNLFIVPVAVAASTALWVERLDPREPNKAQLDTPDAPSPIETNQPQP